MATAKQRADELAKRKAARSAAAVADASPTKGKRKGKRKAGTVKRSKAFDPGADATPTADDADLEGLPRVDAAPDDGGPVGRLG